MNWLNTGKTCNSMVQIIKENQTDVTQKLLLADTLLSLKL